jgi:hypothetical protein
MIKLKLLVFFFAIKNFLTPCHVENKETGFKAMKKGYKIEKVGHLPDSIPESSGLEIAKEGQSFWTHGDGQCKSQLYEVDINGNALSVLPLKNASNIDWEDMAKDDKGNLYIADIGNNLNKRKNLRIYKVNVNENNRIDTINFSYPDQTSFPPEKDEMNFDAEAIFWCKNNLYIISKNRGVKCVNFYKVPDVKGNYVAELFINGIYLNSMITAADISPDKKLVALLSYGKIYFFKAEDHEGSLKLKPYFVKTFSRSKQSEALVFVNNTDLLISNEQGELFLVRKKKSD